jgi:uncharacterized protein YqgV (UPF0045/DUF77 family)
MNHIINLAIQVLPLHMSQPEAYAVVDVAIDKIKQSGLTHFVSPFETVIEGPYEIVMKLVEDIHNACYTAGATSLIVNMKLQSRKDADVAIDDKMEKYSG